MIDDIALKFSRSAALVVVTCLALETPAGFGAEPTVRRGDWTVHGKQQLRGTDLRLDGNLILPAGAELTLEDCRVEIVGDYSRQHVVDWQGGTLITRNCTVGGCIDKSGTAVHTVFHLYEGVWEAVDTVVQYSYGISFHWQKGHGVLRGTRLRAGPRPDAIILSGEADVQLVDSEFPIGLGVYVDQGGTTALDLKPGRAVTQTYDRSTLLPGVHWRLQMQNTHVPRWFLFVRNIGMHHPPATITLQNAQGLIVSLLGHNLSGEITLTSNLSQPLTVGNTMLKTAGAPAEVSMYAVYLSGSDTDMTIRGQSHICELMHRGGNLRVLGDPGTHQLSIGCTTLELSDNATMQASNVLFGRPLSWQSEASVGEATIGGQATLSGQNVLVRDVRFRTQQQGRVRLQHVDRRGRLETDAEGGPVEIELAE